MALLAKGFWVVFPSEDEMENCEDEFDGWFDTIFQDACQITGSVISEHDMNR